MNKSHTAAGNGRLRHPNDGLCTLWDVDTGSGVSAERLEVAP